MRPPLRFLVGFALLASACQPPSATMPPGVEPSYRPGQVLMLFEPETSPEARAALRAKYGARGVEVLPSGTERWVVAGESEALAGAIAREAGVKAAHPNWVRQIQVINPPDQDYATTQKQWHLLPEYLDMPAVWGNAGYATQAVTGQGVIVAVVDSGVDMEHPDLMGNIVQKDGTQAYIDVLVKEELKAPKLDGNGHGTHVAGIIAAGSGNTLHGSGSNQGNIVGVAPEAKLLPVRVMNARGGGEDFDIAKGIELAVDWRGNGDARVDLINLSIGGPKPSSTLAAALAYAARHGVLVVTAAGNYDEPVYYPAAYPGALAVGALNPQNARASYSCYGPQLALMAPGGADKDAASEIKGTRSGIYSTFPSYSNWSGKMFYGAQAGTSMATPVVAGVAALVLAQAKSQGKTLSPDQLRMRLLATATDIGDPGFDVKTGWGKINPARAMSYVKHDEGTP